MTSTPVYSLISTIQMQQIEENHCKDTGQRFFHPNFSAFNSFHDCMEQSVVDAEVACRKRFNGSVIQIWDAKSPSQPSLFTRPFIGDSLKNVENIRGTDNYFRTVFNQPAVNDGNGFIRSFLYHPQAFNNAFWFSSSKSVYYGSVNNKIFASFIHNSEITTHEFGHAVTDLSSCLVYHNQSGALNESVSDVFAIIHKQWNNKTRSAASPDANWLIGEGLIVEKNGPNSPLRSMSQPGTAYVNNPSLGNDPQVSHMNQYVQLPDTMEKDWGGVHSNSGIPNRAFYLAASKSAGPSWGVVGKIWHETLIKSNANDDFSKFALRTIDIAQTNDRNVADLIGKAWQEVGVDLRQSKKAKTN